MLRTSSDFIKLWKDFLAHVGGTPVYPVLFQHLTDGIFKDLFQQAMRKMAFDIFQAIFVANYGSK